MAQGNGIVSAVFSNWHFVSLNTDFEYAIVWAFPHSYDNDSCSCGTNPMCSSQASFNGFIIPGFRVGCYPLETLLQSTLECLYDSSCINQLKTMYYQLNVNFRPLDSFLSSPNVTVQSLVDRLLVERWETNVSYDEYYRTCAPVSCTYIFNGQISVIYTVTIIIGLYGGLSRMFKIMSPILVNIGYSILSYRHRRVGQERTAYIIEEISRN